MFPDVDSHYFGVLVDPDLPDGDQTRETLPDGTLGPTRQLGFAKHAIPGANRVQNSSVGQINTYGTEEELDNGEQQEEAAVSILLNHPVMSKLFDLIFQESDAPGNSSNAGAAGRAVGRRNP